MPTKKGSIPQNEMDPFTFHSKVIRTELLEALHLGTLPVEHRAEPPTDTDHDG